MQKKSVRITITKDGSYTLEALEGFSGSSCVEQTQDLEVAIGGTTVESDKTEAYYNPDDDPSVKIKL